MPVMTKTYEDTTEHPLIPAWMVESVADAIDVPDTAIHMAMVEDHDSRLREMTLSW